MANQNPSEDLRRRYTEPQHKTYYSGPVARPYPESQFPGTSSQMSSYQDPTRQNAQYLTSGSQYPKYPDPSSQNVSYIPPASSQIPPHQSSATQYPDPSSQNVSYVPLASSQIPPHQSSATQYPKYPDPSSQNVSYVPPASSQIPPHQSSADQTQSYLGPSSQNVYPSSTSQNVPYNPSASQIPPYGSRIPNDPNPATSETMPYQSSTSNQYYSATLIRDQREREILLKRNKELQFRVDTLEKDNQLISNRLEFLLGHFQPQSKWNMKHIPTLDQLIYDLSHQTRDASKQTYDPVVAKCNKIQEVLRFIFYPDSPEILAAPTAHPQLPQQYPGYPPVSQPEYRDQAQQNYN